jgi:hypothetical protein
LPADANHRRQLAAPQFSMLSNAAKNQQRRPFTSILNTEMREVGASIFVALFATQLLDLAPFSP